MEKNEPLVSIIIPVYNVEKFIERCLTSIVSQNYEHIEVIVVDDKSSDKSLDIIKKMAQKDSRVTVIEKENEGAGYARNAGMDISSGKYIMFIDSDDYLFQGCIRRAVEVAEKENCDMVTFKYIKRRK